MSKTKIVRTPNHAEGGITAKEKLLMDEVAEKWINVAMRTDPIDPSKIIPVIEGIYAAAGLKKPRVVIAPSPLVMAFAYGASAWILHLRKNHSATLSATDSATLSATDSATYSATYSATLSATLSATRSATLSATDLATLSATDSATYSATDLATRSATYSATRSVTDLATLSATDLATLSATYSATRSVTDLATLSATYSATLSATDSATYSATDSATLSATDSATYSATDLATRSATLSATRSATDLATRSATRSATYSATRSVTDLATRSATDLATDSENTNEQQAIEACLSLSGDGGIKCANRWGNVYQGGNMWAAWCSYLSAARDVLGLKLKEHAAAYAYYEQAALEGGFRVMHEDFCIVSDFPKTILKDDRHRPHCDNGPSHEWRDGWKLWHIHGVRVKEQIVMRPDTLTVDQIDAETNAEVRRVMIDRFTPARYMRESNATILDECSADHPIIGLRTAKLFCKDVPDDESIVMLDMLNSTPEPDGTTKRYMIRVDPNAYGGVKDCLAAMASTYRMADGSLLFDKPSDYAPVDRIMNGTLKETEYHPATHSAMKYVKSLGNAELMKWQESFCSCAIEGDYLAGICAETMRRVL